MHADEIKYHAFIENIKIKNITIPSMNWCLIKKPTKGEPLFTSANLEISDPNIKRKSEITISAKLELIGCVDKEMKKKFMNINIVINFIVQVSQKVFSNELVDKYINRNAIFTIIAIFREQVRNATFQMGLPTLILPAFKMYPRSEESSKKTSKLNKKKVSSR